MGPASVRCTTIHTCSQCTAAERDERQWRLKRRRYGQERCRCKRLEDVESETGAREVETGQVRECMQAVQCNTAAGRWAQPRFGAQHYIQQLRRGMRGTAERDERHWRLKRRRYEQERCMCKRLGDVENEAGARDVETRHVRGCMQAMQCSTAAGRQVQHRLGAQHCIHIANAQLRRGMRGTGD